jgi:SAM-dependent methyltransferase
VPICPSCRAAEVGFDGPRCDNCGWRTAHLDGIPDFLSDSDRDGGVFAEYTALYERIAGDDLDAPIQTDPLLDLEARRLLEALGPVAGAAVCDVGIGRGFLFDRLRAERPRLLVGVDLAWPYLRRVDAGDASVRVLRANAENLPFREELDAIVASDVLEHVLNPADFLHSALEALVPGGRLLLKVPYRENISQYRRADGCPYPMVHLRTFDRSLLRQAIEDAGLRAERFTYSGFYLDRWHPAIARLPVVPGVLKSRLKQRYGDDPGTNRMNPRLARLVIRPVVITALARKPA